MASVQGLSCGKNIRIGNEVHKIVDKDLTKYGGFILDSPLKRDWAGGTAVGIIEDVQEYEDALDINGGDTQVWGEFKKGEGSAKEVATVRTAKEGELNRERQKLEALDKMFETARKGK